MSDTNKPLSPRNALAASRRRLPGALDSLEADLGREVRRPTWREGVALLLIDASSSMAGDKLGFAVQGAVDFAETATRDGLKVGVIAFASDAVNLIAPSGNSTQIAAACRHCEADGSTNLQAGLALAWQVLSGGSSPRRCIVVITDGQPDDEAAALAVADRIKAGGGEILTIGTEDANQVFLQRLASQTGYARHVSPTQLSSTIKATAKLLGLGGPGK